MMSWKLWNYWKCNLVSFCLTNNYSSTTSVQTEFTPSTVNVTTDLLHRPNKRVLNQIDCFGRSYKTCHVYNSATTASQLQVLGSFFAKFTTRSLKTTRDNDLTAAVPGSYPGPPT